jgi:hypothetical protein
LPKATNIYSIYVGVKSLRVVKPKGVKALLTVHGPSGRQALIAISPVPAGFNPANLLDQIRTTLSLHHSQLVVHSVSVTARGFSVVTGLVVSGDDISHILEATRVAFLAVTKADAALPSSTSYLKLVDVLYIMNDRAITSDGVLLLTPGLRTLLLSRDLFRLSMTWRQLSVILPLHIWIRYWWLLAMQYGPANMGPMDVIDHYIRLGS